MVSLAVISSDIIDRALMMILVIVVLIVILSCIFVIVARATSGRKFWERKQ